MLRLTCAFLFLLALPLAAAKHVVLISIDGFAAYHLYNDQLELPNIRGLIDDGVWADSSETVYPSVTHPSHTTIVTGVEPRIHGVLSNGMHNRKTGERFHPTNKAQREIVKAPTIFDAAKAKGMTSATFYWPETKDHPSVNWNLPEVFNPDHRADINAVSPAFLAELRQSGVPIDLYFDWYGTPRKGAGDVILTEAAAYVLRTHRPNILAIHLVSTDATQHQYGSSHYLSHAALTMADHCVGLLKQAAEEAGIAGDTTFVVTADHGFHSVYEQVNIDPVFRESPIAGKVKLVGGGWTVAVQLTGEFDRARDTVALERVFAELKRKRLIRRVVTPDEMHALGQPRFEESDYAFGHYLLIPDIDTHLVADPNSDSTDRQPKQQPSHSHGYLPQHPRMYPALLLSGAGIRSGVTIGHTHNKDIAPTIAHLLGFKMENVSGRVLDEALAE